MVTHVMTVLLKSQLILSFLKTWYMILDSFNNWELLKLRSSHCNFQAWRFKFQESPIKFWYSQIVFIYFSSLPSKQLGLLLIKYVIIFSIYHTLRWIMFFVCTDWLVWKLIARTIHLWTADETESHLKSLIPTLFWYIERNKLIFLYLCGIN